MDKNHEEIEMLDFDNTTSLDETIEMLDFESNIKVSSEIDNLLNSIEDSVKVELDVPKEKIEEYKPSIKDFNIKNAKTRKIVKKAMLYVIIVMLLGFEFFITKTGDTLNKLKVYATDYKPILIEENKKYGYIDYNGNRLVNPKYSFAEEFVKGYAIVKDASNLPLIIDKGGKDVIPTGTYFTLFRAENDIIASKVTKKGLKYGVLDSNLKTKVKFIYDNISFVNGVYTFSSGNYVGLINENGKEIFKYKLTDKDTKSINVKPSVVSDDKNDRYGVVTINSSSQIINLNNGTIVMKPTIDEIEVKENNVFYINKNGTKTYMYAYNNEIAFESIDYSDMSVSSIDAGVIKGITKNYNSQYISVKTRGIINKNISDKNAYPGQNIFMYTKYDYKRNKETIVMMKNGEEYKTIDANFKIITAFKNGIAIVKFSDETFGYINEDGDLITDQRFVLANEFDSYGEAVAKTSNGYGVINNKGKVILDFEYKEIKTVNIEVKKQNTGNNNVFYAAMKDTKYMLYNSKGKRVDKTYYNDVIFDNKYPLFKASTEAYDYIITSEELGKINLTSFKKEYKAYDNYIVIDNNYYNYSGKLIYEVKTKE